MTDFLFKISVGNILDSGKCRIRYEIYRGDKHCTVSAPYYIFPQELYPYHSKENPYHATTNHGLNEEIAEDADFINSLQGFDYKLGQLKKMVQKYLDSKPK